MPIANGPIDPRAATRARAFDNGTLRPVPLRLAIVDDYDIVVAGVAHMFTQYPDRVIVVELKANEPVSKDVDITLFDTFAQGEADGPDLDAVLANRHAGRVVVYTWTFDPDVIDTALAKGAAGYLAKTLPAAELVESLERIAAGEIVVSPAPTARSLVGQDWPGREESLSERESEILALITQGKNNNQIASATFLSVNSVKTYIRTAYAKIGVASRTQAVLWGVRHGLHVDRRRIEDWRSR